ncbi:prophage tail fiber N-terminal domain-containing protein, partial [Salmonella enterica subsp. enterica serovar Bareilly]
MSVVISGVLKDGAGKPVQGCSIELRSKKTSPTVVVHVVATCLTNDDGEYVINAEPGFYDVFLLREGYPAVKAGEIYVTPTDKPDTLNAFLDAPKEGDLRPEVMKRFEEIVNKVIHLSEQVSNDRGKAEAAADAARNAAVSALDSKTQTGILKEQAQRSAEAAAGGAQVSEAARDEAVNAAESARRYHNAASSAATSAELSANTARGHANTATEQARRAKESQDTSAGNAQEAKQYRDEAQQIVDGLNATNASTTEKGLVQLCSATDNDSEALAATPKAVKTVMDEVKTKAPLDSPVFTGTPTTPTPPDDAAGLEMANAAFVRKLLATLVDSSPETLDTLNELAAALGND